MNRTNKQDRIEMMRKTIIDLRIMAQERLEKDESKKEFDAYKFLKECLSDLDSLEEMSQEELWRWAQEILR